MRSKPGFAGIVPGTAESTELTSFIFSHVIVLLDTEVFASSRFEGQFDQVLYLKSTITHRTLKIH